MLLKLSLVVDFINLFTRSFNTCRSCKRKKLLDLTVFFALLGSAHIKAARKMMVKLTPEGGQESVSALFPDLPLLMQYSPSRQDLHCHTLSLSLSLTHTNTLSLLKKCPYRQKPE